MARFDAGQAVEKLEFDFTEYGGGAGTIKEPSTGAVNRFSKQMKALVKEANRLSRSVEDLDVEVEDISEEDLDAALGKIDEAEAEASDFQRRSIEFIAELCGAERVTVRDEDGNVLREDIVGGSPSVEDLNVLPFRVLQAFSGWLMGEIRPKKAQHVGPR